MPAAQRRSKLDLQVDTANMTAAKNWGVNGGTARGSEIESWLRIVAVAGIAFAAVELEKWVRFGGSRGERALPE
jgi:hypothetical protein